MNYKDCCKVYGCAHCPLNKNACEIMEESEIAFCVEEYKKQFPNAKHPD